jgi:hypothetical protein
MVWILESPISQKERDAYKVLLKLLKDKNDAYYRTKVFSLTGYLLSHKFKTANEIHNSVFFDKSKKHPVFDLKASKGVFSKLQQLGGRSGYPFANFVLTKLEGSLPSFIKTPIDTLIWAGQLPIRGIKSLPVVGPFADLGIDLFHGVVEVGVTSAEDIAKDIGGPVGAAGVTVLVAFPSAVAALLAMGQGDGGQAIGHVIKIVPFVGGILSKVLNQVEMNVEKMKKHPDIAAMVPFVGEYVQGEQPSSTEIEPKTAGKRLSTMKHKSSKWLKTQRKRSVKS